MADLISRVAAIAEISRVAAIAKIDEYIEEYSDLEPETGYHNLKWCAMEEAKDVLSMLPAVDAIPVEWLEAQIRSYTGDVSDIGKSARNGTIKDLIRKWQKEQEGR